MPADVLPIETDLTSPRWAAGKRARPPCDLLDINAGLTPIRH